ncbi:acyltransferase family protein [Methylomonas koyamae]|uniref:acyltransferase family protein n=1 Tax=Methylomonas koyamae TaxID=702114 RepID=UPI002872D063|nr:acyltransferase family protein [Methylomonas koyamae]WNB75693.1 acyltransferase family protein [Methylomonas koyamae]
MTSANPHLLHIKYRPDIDGLRAVAVLSVVVFHAFPNGLKGGFIGVDIFFVISGYLISSIIFQNLEKGTFSFGEFYARRVKRIFPSLILVLAASYAFGWFALFADEYKELGKHIAAGAGFVSNFILWGEDGYFDYSAETKPLLHLWSLGIEEQFYIVWPFLIWLAWRRNFNILTVTVLVALVSFYLNMRGIRLDSVATFYSPQTRFWELLCGSMLAWLALYRKGAYAPFRAKLDAWLASVVYRETHEADGRTLANALSFIGLFLLVYGFSIINRNFYFPGKWAVIPMLGAVLIISAGPQAWFNRTILSNRLAVWVGVISFPLYLWHWPLLSFARVLETEVPSVNIRLVAVALSVLLAWLTYRLVEQPIRFGKGNKSKTAVLMGMMLIIGNIGYFSYLKDGFEFRQADAPSKTKLFADVKGTVLFNTPDDWVDDICKAELGASYEYLICRFTTSTPKTLVVGDSHAAQFVYDSISKGANDLALVAVNGCLPFVDLVAINPYEEFSDKASRCRVVMPIVLKVLRDFPSIQQVVFATRGAMYVDGSGYGDVEKKNTYRIIKDPNDLLPENYNRFISGYVASINEILKFGKQVIFVEDVPEIGVEARSCVEDRPIKITDKERPDCIVPRKSFDQRNTNYRHAVGSINAATENRIKIFPAYEYLCDESSCGAGLEDGVSYFYDDDHLSLRGSHYIFGKFSEWLAKASSPSWRN